MQFQTCLKIISIIFLISSSSSQNRRFRDFEDDWFPSPIDPPERKSEPTFKEFLAKEIYGIAKDKSLDFSKAPAGYVISTDKPVYKPGEKIRGQVYFYDKFTKTPVKQNIQSESPKVELKDINGQVVGKTKEFRDNATGVSFVLELDAETPGGFYQIEYKRRGNYLVQRQTVYVLDYSSPSAILTMETNVDVLNGGDQLICQLQLRLLGRSQRGSELEGLNARLEIVSDVLGNIEKLSAETDVKGRAVFRFTFPKDFRGSKSFVLLGKIGFESRVYRVSKQLAVASLNDVVIDFAPENGKWVEGTKNKVYFQAFVNSQKQAPFVFDNAELIVTKSDSKSRDSKVIRGGIKSNDNGMGSLMFDLGRKYRYFIKVKQNSQERVFLIVNGSLYKNKEFANIKMQVKKKVLGPRNQIHVFLQKKEGIKARSLMLVIQDKTNVLYENKVNFWGDQASAKIPIRSLDFAQGGVLTLQVYREGQFWSPDQETLLFVYPEKRLRFGIQQSKKVYTPGDRVRLKLRSPMKKGVLYTAVVTDEAAYAQLESKRLPPGLITKVFLENECFFESGQFYKAGMYLDWFFQNEDRENLKTKKQESDELLDLLLGNQKWRMLFLSGTNLRRIASDKDAFGSEKKGNLEYLLATVLSGLKTIQIRRFAMAANAGPVMDMAMEDDGGRGAVYNKSNEEQPFNNNTQTEPNQNKKEDDTKLRELVKQNDTIFFHPIGKKLRNNVLNFELPDRAGKYRVTIIGVSSRGEYGLHTSFIQAQRPFNIRVDAPLYIRKNDVVILNLILENNTDQTKTIEIGYLNKTRRLRPMSSATELFKINYESVPLKISARDTQNGEVLTKRVSPKKMNGFLFREAGTLILKKEDGQVLSNSFDFELPENVINNEVSVKIEHQPMSPSVFLKGLDRLIREPHGCFEQTSATTFPMVILLQYLNQFDESDKIVQMKLEIEQNLKKGVAKLLSFETPTGGFEWFGQSPGHATLTAYGIWQFLEINEVTNLVPVEVIDRSVNWLRGQFNSDSGHFEFGRGLDSFSRPPLLVSDVYILFVMTLLDSYDVDYSKVLNPWLRRYEAKALEARDSYLLAFVGLAFLNQKNSEEAKKIARVLARNQDPDSGGFKGAETSVTRSRGKSLDVETTAIALIFLQRLDFVKYLKVVNKGVIFLQQNMQTGFFCSTQGTVLSLKALTLNAKLVKNSRNVDREFTFAIGDERRKYQVKSGQEPKALRLQVKSNPVPRARVATTENLQEGEKHIFSVEYRFRARNFKNATNSPLRLGFKRDAFQDTEKYVFSIRNNSEKEQGMVVLILHKPSYIKVNLDDLETLRNSGKIAYYETMNSGSELVFYWRGIDQKGVIDLKLTMVKGFDTTRTDPVVASAYLYYDKQGSFVHRLIE
jgi:hypothetical protein